MHNKAVLHKPHAQDFSYTFFKKMAISTSLFFAFIYEINTFLSIPPACFFTHGQERLHSTGTIIT
jgi:hypothetical protein